MLKRLNHIIFIALVTIAGLFFLAGQTLDLMVFKYRQNVIRKEIKREIKSGVAESELFTFQIKETLGENIKWIKPGKEFRLNGTLFDIVRCEIQEGKLIYKCINDTQETQLFAELDELVRKRMQNDSDDELKNLAKDFVKIFFDSESPIWIPSIRVNTTGYKNQFNSASLSILSPPPRA